MAGSGRRGGWRVWAPLLAVWAALVVAAFVLDDSGSAFGAILGGGLGSLLAARFLIRPRMRRLARRNQVECGLRVIEGREPGLGRRWRHGVGTPAPGC
jgi:heme oxygenase